MALTHCHVAVQPHDFDVSAELDRLTQGRTGVGAVASFVGVVRRDALPAPAQGGAAPHALELEHYPGMTESSITAMAHHVAERFELDGVRVIHRIGRLMQGERIVLVAVSSPHRRAAFEGCEMLMDWLKTQAPFWKKEHAGQDSHWVDARESDDDALARWGEVPGGVRNAGGLDGRRTLP